MRGDSLFVKMIDKLGDDKPAEPVAPFTLPSQRKSGTAAWKVLILMVLIGTALGIYECRQQDLIHRAGN